MSRPTPTPLRRDREFLLFLVGQASSALGDSARLILLPLLVLELSGSGLAMGIVGMLETLPTILFGLPAGVLADRWDRRRMMLYSDTARTALIAFIPLSMVLELDTVAVVMVIAVPLGFLEQTFEAACIPCVPALVGRERLAAANSYLQACNSVGFVAGPALAGILAATLGADQALWLDAGSFLISAATLAAIRRPLQEHAREGLAPLRWGSLAAEVRAGVRYIVTRSLLRAAVLLRGGLVFVTAPLVPVATYFLERDLGRASAIGWVMTSYCVGALLGSVVASLLRKRALGPAMVLAGVTTGVGLVGLSFAGGGMALLVALAIVTGVAFSVQQIAYQTFCALATPDELLGRVSGCARVLTISLSPLSLVVAGVLLDTSGGARVLCAMGALSLVVSVAFAPALRRPLSATP